MRYITIPESIKVKGTDPKGTVALLDFSFGNLLEQFVWPNKVWRDGSIDNLRAYSLLLEKFKDAKPGDVVAIDDATYEKFAPIATLRGSDMRPELVQDMMKLMAAVIEAGTTPPATEEKPAISEQN